MIPREEGRGNSKSSPLVRAAQALNAEKLWSVLPWAMVLAGVLLRFHRYMQNRSLWIDEVVNATNILTKSFSQLLLQPMDYNLTAPRGFWIVERFAVRLLGDGEYALRLFPLVCGVVSLPLFWGVARRYVRFGAVLVGLSLFALSNQMAYFSAQVKQYSSDVLVSILLIWLGAFAVQGDRSIRQIVLIGVVGAAAIWFSYPAIFILAGIGLTLLLSSLYRWQWKQIVRFVVAFSMWGASFFILYVNSLGAAGNNSILAGQWAGSYMPFPPVALADWKWLWDHFLVMFDDPVGLSLTGVAAFAFLVGCASLLNQSKLKFLLLLLPLAFVLAASAVRRYPFSGRVLLFLAPLVLLIVAEGVVQIWSITRDKASFVGIAFAGLLFLPVLLNVLASPPAEEIKPVMSRMRMNYQKGDVIYLYYGANLAFEYYAPKFGFTEQDYIAGVGSRNDWKKYADQLERLRENKRVWVVFSHIWTANGVDEERLFLYILDNFGTRVDSFRTAGAALYLYDLQTQPQSRPSTPYSGDMGSRGCFAICGRFDRERVDSPVGRYGESERGAMSSQTFYKPRAPRSSFVAG